ncbi:MAG: hypothetical protein WC900_06340, partial [Oscillospiraceae bacterium]
IDDNYLEELYDALDEEFGDVKLSYKIVDKDELDEDDLDDFKDEIKDIFSERVKIKSGYELEVEFTVKGDDDDDTIDADVVVLKIDGDWFVYSKNCATIFDSYNNYMCKPIDNMIKGIENQDADIFLSAYPEFLADQMDSYIDDDTMEDMYDSFEDEYGKNIKISYKVTDKDKLDKDDLTDYEEEIDDYYDEKVDIAEGYEVEVELTIEGDDDNDNDDTDFVVLKIDGDWCVYDGGLY